MVEYYLAEKSCMMGVHSCLMLGIEGKAVTIVAGESNEKFGFDEEGKIACLTWDGMSLPYHVTGPIPEERAKKLMGDDCHNGYEHYFDRLPRRITSMRGIGARL